MDKENEQKMQKDEGCSCGSRGSCGCHCGIKVIMAIVLLLLGGVIGFLMGKSCMGRYGYASMCPMPIATPSK